MKHDWAAIRAYYEAGHTVLECRKKFRFWDVLWKKAAARGDVVPRSLEPPLSQVAVRNSTYKRANLKRRLIKHGIIPYVCAICGQPPEWNGAPLVLILDHKNGINDDHRIENLRFVCPNCGSQLPTFAARNIRRPVAE